MSQSFPAARRKSVAADVRRRIFGGNSRVGPPPYVGGYGFGTGSSQHLNDDKPYARFIREQLAGGELWPDDPQARIATAFNRQFWRLLA